MEAKSVLNVQLKPILHKRDYEVYEAAFHSFDEKSSKETYIF